MIFYQNWPSNKEAYGCHGNENEKKKKIFKSWNSMSNNDFKSIYQMCALNIRILG